MIVQTIISTIHREPMMAAFSTAEWGHRHHHHGAEVGGEASTPGRNSSTRPAGPPHAAVADSPFGVERRVELDRMGDGACRNDE
jgi:hypothetical protein